MIIENIYPIAATSGGGFIASYLVGYFIKKVIKILMFVLGGNFNHFDVSTIPRNSRCTY